MDSFIVVILTIILGGAAGGIANFCLMSPPASEMRTWQGLLRLSIGGLIVAFTVPLFLSLAQSTLIQQILKPEDQLRQHLPELLILAGFCVAASFASRNFMDTISQRVLAAVSEAKAIGVEAKAIGTEAKTIAKTADAKAEEATEAAGLAEESIDRITGDAKPQSQLPKETTPALEGEAAKLDLTDLQKRVLQATGHLTMRTATGIAKDAGIRRDQVGEILDELVRMNLVEKASSPNTGGLRSRLTQLGIATLNRQLR
jgi:hypothetical protein